MPSRRTVLKSLFAASALPRTLWADAGSPRYLSAARVPDGSFRLFGIDANGEDVFSVSLPGRGHSVAAHPLLAEAIVFARRPGRFALVVDCSQGNSVARLESPPNRHFYGHGAFSADGNLLFTTENDFESGQGRIGVWNRSLGYKRVREFSSGGVGPHEIVAVRDAGILVVANGGIETHPETGRQRLNLPFMKPNLAYVSENGRIEETLEMPEKLNSIRHLSVGGNGDVAFAMQWQSSPSAAPSLLGLHRMGGAPRLFSAEGRFHSEMKGYTGSVAFSRCGSMVAVSSPRGGSLQIFDSRSGDLLRHFRFADASGLAPLDGGFLVSTGEGAMYSAEVENEASMRRFDRNWDNHLVSI